MAYTGAGRKRKRDEFQGCSNDNNSTQKTYRNDIYNLSGASACVVSFNVKFHVN